MRLFYGALTAALLGAPAAMAQAPAPVTTPDTPTYVVTYLEIIPSAKGEARDLLKQVAEASRKEQGNTRYDVLQRIDRDNQFVILEAWSTLNAQQAHGAGAGLKQFQAKLTPLRSGPYDERPSVGVALAPAAGGISGDAIYAVTHVDVTPNFKDDCIGMLQKIADESRKEPGSIRFEAWQQNNRANHFTVAEIWKDPAAEAAHVISMSTREFREKLGPMTGALYDERLYKKID